MSLIEAQNITAENSGSNNDLTVDGVIIILYYFSIPITMLLVSLLCVRCIIELGPRVVRMGEVIVRDYIHARAEHINYTRIHTTFEEEL
jgi:hypothetical protein